MRVTVRCFLCPGDPILAVKVDDAEWLGGYETHYARKHYVPPPKSSPDHAAKERSPK